MTWLSLILLAGAILTKVSTTFEYYVKMVFLYVSYLMTGALVIPYGK
jgi:hypothetical protein